MLIDQNGFQRSQRVAASSNVYNSSQARPEPVMVETALDEYDKTIKRKEGYIYIRLARVLCFLGVCLNKLAAEMQGPETTSTSEELHICQK